MFEISQLKEMKLPELQEIAKKLNVSKYRSLKKLDLVYQILDQQADNPKAVTEVIKKDKPERGPQRKPRQRVQKPSSNTPQKQEDKTGSENVAKDEPIVQKTEEKHQPQKREQKPKPKPVAKTQQNEDNTQQKGSNQQRDNRQKRDHHQKGNNRNQNTGNNGNKDTRNRYREPDFEFDAIIESEGVLDIMQDWE